MKMRMFDKGYKELKRKVKEKYAFKCYVCGKKEDLKHGVKLQIHHVKPRYFGGGDYEGNLVPLCEDCHRKVHERIDSYIRIEMAGKDAGFFWQVLRETRKDVRRKKNGKEFHRFKDLIDDLPF